MPLTPQDFVSKWKRADAPERQSVQEHFIDLCALVWSRNARPTWLDLAHKRLDEAVFTAYGWKSDLTDEEILEKLLSLNLKRGK